tara:strand:+ start:1071 stop:1808 length:738 start_codon:yes stop_codon:yes gene_type:complete
MLIRRNISIQKKLINKSIPVIIIHEGNITPEQEEYIKGQTPLLNIVFWVIDFDRTREHVNVDENTKMFNMGYRHMCSFWFVDMWNTEIFKDFDYILRIDEDCEMRTNIDRIFKQLTSSDKYYAICANMDGDAEYVTRYMNDTTLSFMTQRRINDKKALRYKEPGGPMTQMTGFNMKRLRNESILHEYIRHIHNTQMIYINRWGDHSLWGEVFFYILPNKLKVDKSIQYFHGSHVGYSHEGKINYQ